MNKFISYKISFFNFFLSVLIVILHSNCQNTLGWVNDGSMFANALLFMSSILTMIGHLAVPTFFMMSGFLFYRNIQGLQDTFVKIKKRVRTLLIPYLLWNTFFVCLFWCILNTPLVSYMHMPNSLQTWQDIVLAILNSSMTPLWFVKDLMIYVLLSPVIYYISRNIYVLLFSIIIAILYAVNANVNYFSLIYWLPIYLVGIMQNKSFANKWFVCEKQDESLACGFYLASFLLLMYVGLKYEYLYLYRLFAPLVIWRVSSNILLLCNFNKRQYWKYSFFIYCTHFFIINIVQKIMFILMGCSNVSYLLIYLSTPFIVLIICICIARIMESHVNQLYNILTGNR